MMHRTGLVFIWLWGVFGSGAIAAEKGIYIEQKVTMDATAGQPTLEGTQRIWFTKDYIRNETSFGEQTTVAILDMLQKRIILMPSEEKQYIEMKLEDYWRIVSMRVASSGLNDPQAKPRLIHTGIQRQIGNYQCLQVVFEQGGRLPVKSVMWVSKDAQIDFNVYWDLMKKLGMEKILGGLSEFVTSIDGYPIEVRTEQVQNNQTLVSTIQVTKISMDLIDPALFQVPKDYQRVETDSLSGSSSEKK